MCPSLPPTLNPTLLHCPPIPSNTGSKCVDGNWLLQTIIEREPADLLAPFRTYNRECQYHENMLIVYGLLLLRCGVSHRPGPVYTWAYGVASITRTYRPYVAAVKVLAWRGHIVSNLHTPTA